MQGVFSATAGNRQHSKSQMTSERSLLLEGPRFAVLFLLRSVFPFLLLCSPCFCCAATPPPVLVVVCTLRESSFVWYIQTPLAFTPLRAIPPSYVARYLACFIDLGPPRLSSRPRSQPTTRALLNHSECRVSSLGSIHLTIHFVQWHNDSWSHIYHDYKISLPNKDIQIALPSGHRQYAYTTTAHNLLHQRNAKGDGQNPEDGICFLLHRASGKLQRLANHLSPERERPTQDQGGWTLSLSLPIKTIFVSFHFSTSCSVSPCVPTVAVLLACLTPLHHDVLPDGTKITNRSGLGRQPERNH